MFGFCAACSGCFCRLLYNCDLCIGIRKEAIDTYNGINARLADGVDMLDHVFTALFHQLKILFGVSFIKGQACHDLGSTAMHLKSPDGGCQDRNVGFQAAVPAFDIPEFLKPDVSAESALGNMIIKQLEPYTIGDD